jgi:2-amino-4-hydroxy-6-hydroxymethyldihydropteridine diphosphokinase
VTLAYVALGANLGKADETVTTAIAALAAMGGCRLVAASSLYRTAPVGLKHQPDFINAVAALETELSAGDLLRALFAVEARFGRERNGHNAPRTLDLDLLLHGDTRMDSLALTLPHARMHERAFVLAPLAEIAPDLVIAGRGAVTSLLAGVGDQRIERLETVV